MAKLPIWTAAHGCTVALSCSDSHVLSTDGYNRNFILFLSIHLISWTRITRCNVCLHKGSAIGAGGEAPVEHNFIHTFTAKGYMLALALTRRRMFSEESTAACTVTTAILFCYNACFHSETKKRRLSVEPFARLVLCCGGSAFGSVC